MVEKLTHSGVQVIMTLTGNGAWEVTLHYHGETASGHLAELEDGTCDYVYGSRRWYSYATPRAAARMLAAEFKREGCK